MRRESLPQKSQRKHSFTAAMSTPVNLSSVSCEACGASNPADYRFCADCGNALHAEQQTPARAREPAPNAAAAHLTPAERPTSGMSNRAQLRLTLLASAGALLLVGVASGMLAGVQWAVAPFALAIFLVVTSFGRMSHRSLTLFKDDLREILDGAPAAAERSVQTGGTAAQPAPASPALQERPPASVDAPISEAAPQPTAQSATQPAHQPAPQTPAAGRSDIACGACGELNPPTYRFCAECGGRLQGVASTPVQDAVSAEADAAPVTAPTVPPVAAPQEASYTPAPIAALRERQLGIAAMAFGLLAAALSLYMFPKGPPNTLAWWGYGLSVALTLAAVPAFEGGWSAFLARFRRGYQVSFEPRALLPWAALGGILALALIIRVHNLDELPPGLWFDEADLIEEAMRIADNPGSTPVFVAFQNLPSLMSALTAIQFELNGVSISSARIVAAMFGVAGCAAIFLLVRHMLGTAMGLVAAFLTAVMRWDIIWSRVALHGITLPFFAALSAWLTYRAIRGKRTIDYALAGSALGLGAWFYSPFRMFPIVIGFVLLHALVFSEAEKRRKLLANIGVLILFALIVAAPVVQVALVFPEEFFRRTGVVFAANFVAEDELLAVLWENLKRHLLMFHFEGDPNGRHNIPGAPMLDVISGALMLAGLVIAAFHWRRAAFIALPVWLLVMVMPGVLTIPWEAPQSLRSITVIPAVIALITIAIDFVWKLGGSSHLRLVRVASAAAICAALIAIAYTNLNTYFNVQANHPEVYAAFSTDETLITDDMSEQASRGYIPMVSRQFRHSLVAKLIGQPFPRQTIAAPLNIPIDAQLVWLGAAIYLEPRETGFYDTLKAYYPSAEFREVRPPAGGDAMYYSAYISREELEAAQGLVARVTTEDGTVTEYVKTDTESVWQWEATGQDAPFDVEWTGTLHVTHAGEYALALESSSPASVMLDGVVILSQDAPRVNIEPAVGLHRLEVQARVTDADGALRMLWRQPPRPLEAGDEPPQADDSVMLLEPITARNLYHGEVRPIGLAGRFFKGMRDAEDIGDAAPDAMRVTPNVGSAFWYDSVVGGEHLAVWDGNLNAPESGTYRFRFGEAHGEMRVVIDGETVIDTRANREAEVELLAGRHRIRLEYMTGAGSPWFEVLWAPPGQAESRIRPEYLSPAPEYMFRVIGEE